MSLTAPLGESFFTRKGQEIRCLALEKTENGEERATYYYQHMPTGRRFDVRDLPFKYVGWQNSMGKRERDLTNRVLDGDSASHRKVITDAIDDGYDFVIFASPMDVIQRIRDEMFYGANAVPVAMRLAENGAQYFGEELNVALWRRDYAPSGRTAPPEVQYPKRQVIAA